MWIPLANRLDIGRKFLEYGDKMNAVKVLEDAIEHVGEGWYMDIYWFIDDDLHDNARAQRWKDDYWDEMKSEWEQAGNNIEDLL